MTIWELIEAGEFEKASQLASDEYRDSGDIFPLFNKRIALMNLKKYDEVISLSKYILNETNFEGSTDYVYCAIAYWLLGRYSDAIDNWTKAWSCKYQDASGGVSVLVYLYFVSICTRDSALNKRTLKKLAKINNVNWPAPISLYLLNKIDRNQMLSCVDTVPILRERQMCQADFASAIKSLENNNDELYKFYLEKAIETPQRKYLEEMLYLAKGELERIDNRVS
jgi:tetratricopeptide (TPR) repeat protein